MAGDLVAGEELLNSLRPFVYRRYIDFGAVEALHSMYMSLREDSARHERTTDIKRGPGGIREIEFLVQTFQLLRGGREPGLQTNSLLQALKCIEQLSILPVVVTRALAHDYAFLRHLENAIQALHDQQTHSLPSGEDLERITRVMGHEKPEDLLAELENTRSSVLTHIKNSFPEHGSPSEQGPSRTHWETLKASERTSRDSPEEPLDAFMTGLSRLKLSSRASRRLDKFMPGLLDKLEQHSFTTVVLTDILNLVLAICRRSAYLSLLVQNPPALERMLVLFGESDWIAATVIRHPALLDELIDPSLGKMLPDRDEMNSTARRVLESNQDTETALQTLNHMKLAFSLRIAVAELETTLSAQQVQQSLTSLAETLLQGCFELAMNDVKLKHGNLEGSGIGIIGYGSLGAMALSYNSDLDLIFLYRQSADSSDGARSLEPERYYTAVVRRLLSFLTASTPSGRLYEVDTRLRPNGRSGLLVSSLSAFEKYQKKEAWTWELQALSRARSCAGSAEIGQEFSRLRMEILVQASERDELRSEVQKMRNRLREAQTDGDSFKHGDGGLIDIDFIAQLGVLEFGTHQPSVLNAIGTGPQLQALCETGWLNSDQFKLLSDNLDSLTQNRHLALLSRQHPGSNQASQDCLKLCRSYLDTSH